MDSEHKWRWVRHAISQKYFIQFHSQFWSNFRILQPCNRTVYSGNILLSDRIQVAEIFYWYDPILNWRANPQPLYIQYLNENHNTFCNVHNTNILVNTHIELLYVYRSKEATCFTMLCAIYAAVCWFAVFALTDDTHVCCCYCVSMLSLSLFFSYLTLPTYICSPNTGPVCVVAFVFVLFCSHLRSFSVSFR